MALRAPSPLLRGSFFARPCRAVNWIGAPFATRRLSPFTGISCNSLREHSSVDLPLSSRSPHTSHCFHIGCYWRVASGVVARGEGRGARGEGEEEGRDGGPLVEKARFRVFLPLGFGRRWDFVFCSPGESVKRVWQLLTDWWGTRGR
jgi:hypothetical protein